MSDPAQTLTREMPALHLRAEFVPASLNEEERTVDVVWTTGARVLRGWWDPYWEELSLDPKHVRMDRLTSGRAPVLMGHNSYDPDAHVGVVMSARLEKGRGVATLRYAKGDADADKAWNKVRQGILPNVSVGYRIHKIEKIEDGEGKIPVMRATDWEPYEISPVSLPADADAHVRAAAPASNPCEFVFTRGEAPQKESRTMSEKTQNPAPTEGDGQRAATPPAPAVDLKVERERAATEERARIAGIQLAARATGFDPEKTQKMITEGTALDAARAAMLEAAAARSDSENIRSHVRVEAGEDQRDKFVRGATAALIERAGVADMLTTAAKHERFGRKLQGLELDGGEFRGMTLLDLARASLERRGISTRGMDRMTLAKRALEHRSGGGMQTISDFAVLFENAIGKILLGAYAITPDTWSKFCKTDTVPDFRDSPRYRTGSLSTLDSVAEGGEFKNKAIPDGEKRAINVATKGNIVALSRQAIVNDDMSALSDLATKLGRAAKLSIETDVYALLTANAGLGATQSDAQPFFHASRANISAGGAISSAAFDTDRIVMASQRDVGGNEFLDLRPAVLLVPLALESQARVINSSVYDHDGSKLQKPNPVVGLFREVVSSPRLSGTRRYGFADPAVAAAIIVAFLEGSGQEPVLESMDGFRIDGVEWKVRLDYRAQTFDPKAAYTSAGA